MRDVIKFALCFLILIISPSLFCTKKQVRDPFSFPALSDKKSQKKEPFHVIGVVHYKKTQGILVQDGEKQRTLVIGDKIRGYTLHAITAGSVEFVKKNKIKRVDIR